MTPEMSNTIAPTADAVTTDSAGPPDDDASQGRDAAA
jgi:hypothetical protein